jgi:thiamine biosynthesis lipoprotein
MGTDVEVILTGGSDGLLDLAQARIEGLEARWSRFRPDSELLRLHAHPGRPVVVSDETYAVLELSIDAWRATRGAFDPSVHDAVRAAGYTDDFDHLERQQAPGTTTGPAPGLGAVHLDPLVRSVTTAPSGYSSSPAASSTPTPRRSSRTTASSSSSSSPVFPRRPR